MTSRHDQDMSFQCIPVLVAAVEQVTKDVLQVGNLVLWPRRHLAIPNTRFVNKPAPDNQKEMTEELPSSISEISPGLKDKIMNYSLQRLQLGVIVMQLNVTDRSLLRIS